VVATAYKYAPVGVGGGDLWRRLGANAVDVVVMLVALRWSRVHTTRSYPEMALGLVTAAMYSAVARVVAQAALDVYPVSLGSTQLVELTAGFIPATATGVAGAVVMVSRRRLRTGIEAGAAAKIRIELALRALQDEEVRVRREVAAGEWSTWCEFRHLEPSERPNDPWTAEHQRGREHPQDHQAHPRGAPGVVTNTGEEPLDFPMLLPAHRQLPLSRSNRVAGRSLRTTT
jgi:hypothetical protein